VSKADLRARGLTVPTTVAQLDDAQLVQQVLQYQHTLSWS
jgi:sulfur transfer complex TusBCD TusB component (DsrH family)